MLSARNISVAVAALTVLIGFFIVEYQITTNSELYHVMAVKEVATQVGHQQQLYLKNLEALRKEVDEQKEKYISARTKLEVLELQCQKNNNGGSTTTTTTTTCVPSLKLIGPAAGWVGRNPTYPTYAQLRTDIFGGETTPVYEGYPNFYKKASNHLYPHTFIAAVHLDEFWAIKKPKFVVEVGSFTGGSTTVIGKYIKSSGLKDVPFLCIDTWLGDLNMWLNKAVWEFLDVRFGRPTVFDQWLLNVVAANLTDIVVPLSVTSLIGARWLKAHNYIIDFLYLDSAHEIDETFFELELYWDLLAPGGVLAGDDWNWDAVRIDVTKFSMLHNIQVRYVTNERGAGGPWFLVKPT